MSLTSYDPYPEQRLYIRLGHKSITRRSKKNIYGLEIGWCELKQSQDDQHANCPSLQECCGGAVCWNDGSIVREENKENLIQP